MPNRRPSGVMVYLAERAAYSVPLVLVVVTVTFFLIHLAPGDPVSALTGNFPASPQFVAELREEYGLNESVWSQYLAYITQLVQGDLGYSFANQEQVLSLILDRLGNTALLMLASMLLAIVVGIPLGVLAARRPGSILDTIASFVGTAGYAVPVFWLGQLLILSFALKLSLLPSSGMTDLRSDPDGLGHYLDVLKHLILPAVALSFRYAALYTRVTRSSMRESLAANYIYTARAKGVPESRVVRRHALHNASLPIVTIIGYELGFALSGSVLVETVFTWPGVGRLLYTSILGRDAPVIVGIFIVLSLAVIVANLIADLLYAWIDPRVRYGKTNV